MLKKKRVQLVLALVLTACMLPLTVFAAPPNLVTDYGYDGQEVQTDNEQYYELTAVDGVPVSEETKIEPGSKLTVTAYFNTGDLATDNFLLDMMYDADLLSFDPETDVDFLIDGWSEDHKVHNLDLSTWFDQDSGLNFPNSTALATLDDAKKALNLQDSNVELKEDGNYKILRMYALDMGVGAGPTEALAVFTVEFTVSEAIEADTEAFVVANPHWGRLGDEGGTYLMHISEMWAVHHYATRTPLVLPVTVDTEEPEGVTVSGTVTSYNEKNETIIQLLDAEGIVRYSTKIEAKEISTGSYLAYAYSIEDVAPGVYSLVVQKSGHVSYTINGIVVSDSAVELGEATLPVGDIDGDGMVNIGDVSEILKSDNYGRQSAAAGNPNCDINGDGLIGIDDVAIVLMASNYGKSAVVVSAS